jgi:hypothetical protein
LHAYLFRSVDNLKSNGPFLPFSIRHFAGCSDAQRDIAFVQQLKKCTNEEALYGDAIAIGQKPTLSRCGIGLSQRAKAFAIKLPFDVKAVFSHKGLNVRVARR